MTRALYPSFTVLLVDDEADWLASMALRLELAAGISNFRLCQDSREVLAILENGGIGLVLLDLTMPHLSGEDLLQSIAEQHPQVICIIISGQNQLQTAVHCIKQGAFDYYVKTDEEERLIGGILRAIRMCELEQENREVGNRLVSGELQNPEAFVDICTRSHAMHNIFSYIEAVAPSPRPLLITGESGVGKENLVRAAHFLSGCDGPLVALNAAGLDDTVFTDTLFGHVRGAFTGADSTRPGLVEEAAEGTLFLDEIGDLSIPSQIKLLRLLQEGEYYPLGSDRPRRLRARVIAATHANLLAREQAGLFRRDLYYRLCMHHVHIPPLRERQEDIELLLRHYLAEAARATGKKIPDYPADLVPLLLSYSFPGNVRELQAMVYNAMSLHQGTLLALDNFRQHMGGSSAVLPAPSLNPFTECKWLPTFAQAEEMLLNEAMLRAGGKQTLAARMLGISQSAISKRLKNVREG
ncbi:MAG: sigma-54 dependent transcriptional regulator [Deltaproteobacteria bacterium]|jgi:DNA-binding NtrC family response regulator|nr:sigma-54 dependent transcriptional regulator [Deltaproteobacteria bacterium]